MGKYRNIIFTAMASIAIYPTIDKYIAYRTNTFQNEPEDNNMKVRSKSAIVVGGGIIGISQAMKLLSKGYEVTLIEKSHSIATVCSAYNGNILSPLFNVPLVTTDNLSFMLKNYQYQSDIIPKSININVIQETNFLQWIFNALWSEKSFNDKLEIQHKIGSLTMQLWSTLAPLNLNLSNGYYEALGQIVVFTTEQRYQQYAKFLNEHDVKFQTISSIQELQAVQASSVNQNILNQFHRAIVVPSVTSLDTRDLCIRMYNYCQSTFKDRFKIRLSSEVQGFVINQNNKVFGVNTNKGIVYGDNVIICSSIQSKHIVKKLGTYLPIIPGRGWVLGKKVPNNEDYSLMRNYTLQLPSFSTAIVQNNLRISFGLELCKEQEYTNPSEEIPTFKMLNYFNKMTGLNYAMDELTVRSCLRPLTPDDAPIISHIPKYDNVYVNAGHASRGLSYCLGSAEIISQLMDGQNNFKEYDVNRFYFI